MLIYLQIAATPLHDRIWLRVPLFRCLQIHCPNHEIFCEIFPRPNVFVKSLMQPILSLFHFWRFLKENWQQKFFKNQGQNFSISPEELFSFLFRLYAPEDFIDTNKMKKENWKIKWLRIKTSFFFQHVVPEQLKSSLNKVLFHPQ